jgi:hypothetical protein
MTAFWHTALCGFVEIEHYGHLKRRSNATKLHGDIPQNDVIIILATVRTLHFTNLLVSPEPPSNKQ